MERTEEVFGSHLLRLKWVTDAIQVFSRDSHDVLLALRQLRDLRKPNITFICQFQQTTFQKKLLTPEDLISQQLNKFKVKPSGTTLQTVLVVADVTVVQASRLTSLFSMM